MTNLPLHTKNLYKSYRQADQELIVLKGITATFEPGKTYAITGVSGSGKSTFLHLLAGLDEPTQGFVYYGNQDLAQLTSAEKVTFLTRSIGLVFQQPYLIREMTILENVMIKGLLGFNNYIQTQMRAKKLLEQVGLADKIEQYPGQLSGGQQQRVAIARALMNQPEFLLADEPTGSLDVKTGESIMELLLQLREHWNMGLIVSSHEPYVYEKMETIFELKDGNLHRESLN